MRTSASRHELASFKFRKRAVEALRPFDDIAEQVVLRQFSLTQPPDLAFLDRPLADHHVVVDDLCGLSAPMDAVEGLEVVRGLVRVGVVDRVVRGVEVMPAPAAERFATSTSERGSVWNFSTTAARAWLCATEPSITRGRCRDRAATISATLAR